MRRYVVFIALLLGLLAYVGHRFQRLRDPAANVPIVTLVGPSEVKPGVGTRFVVLVHERTGSAIVGAKVRLGLERNGFDELGFATTGAGGEAAVEITVPGDLVVGEGRLLRAKVDTPVGEGRAEQWVVPLVPTYPTVIITTDRPEYSSGDTAHVRATLEHDGHAIGERPATIRVTRDLTTLFRFEARTSPFGVVDAEFPVAEQPDTNPYPYGVSVTLPCPTLREPTRTCTGRSFVNVRTRRAPKATIVVDEVAVTDAKVEGIVRAWWPSGMPARDTPVRVTLDEHHQAKAKLDREGRYRFSFSAPEKLYGVEAELTDDASFGTGAEGRVRASWVPPRPPTSDNVLTSVYPEGGVLVAGAVQTLYIATDAKDRHLTARVEGLGAPVNVSPLGVAKLTVTVPQTPFEVVLTDDDGHRSTTPLHPETVPGALDPTAPRWLQIHAEKDTFASGTAAHVAVYGGMKGKPVVLLTSKGQQLLDSQSAVASGDGVASFDVPLEKGVEGLVWLEAISERSAPGRRLIMVATPREALRVKVAAPGEARTNTQGFVDVEVTDAKGGPVRAELSVAAVDAELVGHDYPLAARRPRAGLREFERRCRDFNEVFGDWASDGADAAALAESDGDEELRGLLLARLGRDRAPRFSSARRYGEPADDGEREHRRENLRLRGWCTIVLALLALALFLPFLWFGFDHVTRRARRPHEPAPKAERDRRRIWMTTASGVFALGVLVPPVFGIVAERLTSSTEYSAIVWAAAALITTCGVVEALRRTRTSWLLAPGLLVAHAACIVSVLDHAQGLGVIFEVAFYDRYLVALVLVIAGQLVFAFFGVVRLATTEHTNLIDRRARFWRGALIAGLPLTMGVFGYGAYLHVRAANISWSAMMTTSEGATQLVERNVRRHQGANATAGSSAYPGPLRGDYEITASVNPDAWPYRGSRVLHPNAFAPTLLWKPHIVTDENGHARIPIDYGSTATAYGLSVDAVTRSGSMGRADTTFETKPAFGVEVVLPTKLTEGDEIEWPITVFAEEAEDFSVTVAGKTSRLKVAARGHATALMPLSAITAGKRTIAIEVVGSKHHQTLERELVIRPSGHLTEVVQPLHDATVSFPADGGSRALSVTLYGSPQARFDELVPQDLEAISNDPHTTFEQIAKSIHPSIAALDYLTKAKVANPDLERRARTNVQFGVQRLIRHERQVAGDFAVLPESDLSSSPTTVQALHEFEDLTRVVGTDPDVTRRIRANMLSQKIVDDAKPHPTSGLDAPSIQADLDVDILVDGNRVETVHLEKKERAHPRTIDLSKYAAANDVHIEVPNKEIEAIVRSAFVRPFTSPTDEALSLSVTYPAKSGVVGMPFPARVKIVSTAAEPGKDPVVEIPIPPSLAIVESDLVKLFVEGESLGYLGRSRTEVKTRKGAIEGGKVVIYLEDLPSHRAVEFDIPFIAVLPGKVLARPSTARLDHDSAHVVSTLPSTLNVK